MKQQLRTLYVIAALEKTTFNAVRVSLIFYLTKSLLMSDVSSYQLYAAMMALSFLSPLITGAISDHFIGKRLAAAAGGLLMAASSVALCAGERFLAPSLALLVLGSGAMKSTIPNLLSDLTEKHQLNRDSVFATLYRFFNIGSLVGICCGVMGESWGWYWAFALGSVSGASAFFLSLRIESTNTRPRPLGAFLLSALFVLGTILILKLPWVIDNLVYVAFLAIPAFLLWGWLKSQWTLSWMAQLLLLMLSHSLFFSLYEQGGLSILVYSERWVDRGVGSFLLPATFFQGFDPFLNVLCGGLFATLWIVLEKRAFPHSPWPKFALGFFFAAASFFVLAIGGSSILLLIVGMFLFVMGEQVTVPVGFSAITSMAPKRMKSMMLGLWYASIASSEIGAGVIARHYFANIKDVSAFSSGFMSLALLSVVTGMVILVAWRCCPVGELAKARGF